MLIAGVAVLASTYAASSLAGAIIFDTGDDSRRRNFGRRMMIPVVGPFLAATQSGSATGAWFTSLLGVAIHQALTGRINVIDFVCQMAERPTDAVVLWIPVVGQLDLRVVVAWCGEKHEREPAFLALGASELAQSERIAIELQRFIEMGHADHCVEVAQRKLLTTSF